MIRFQDLTVRDVMTEDPICLPSDATLDEAEQLLLDAGVEEAPILSDGGEYLGSCSLRELLLARREGASTRARTVGSLASPGAPTCEPTVRLAEACQLMIRSRARRVVVLEGGRPVGVVSAVEAARVLACLEDMNPARQADLSFSPEACKPVESN